MIYKKLPFPNLYIYMIIYFLNYLTHHLVWSPYCQTREIKHIIDVAKCTWKGILKVVNIWIHSRQNPFQQVYNYASIDLDVLRFINLDRVVLLRYRCIIIYCSPCYV